MKSYLDMQLQFWKVDPTTSEFGRVDTVSADEVEYAGLAESHFERICSNVMLSELYNIGNWVRGGRLL
jgi:hypothetical protein